MFIVFGTRGITTTKEKGEFHCPQCGNSQAYRWRNVNNFFTLYFIPLIPLGKAGEYVECGNCRSTFVPRVLEYTPELPNTDFKALYEQAIRHAMVLMMLADGEIDENEMTMVQEIINKFSKNQIDKAELEAYVDVVMRENEDISTYLKKITPSLNEHGKEMIMRCAIAVAGSDGHIDETEKELMSKMAKVMEMSPSHVQGILSDIAQN